MKRLLVLSVVALAGVALTPGVGHAAPIQLAVAIDASGSVSTPNFNLQKNGLASAVNTVIGGLPDGSVELSVVVFSSGPAATPINHVLVNSGNLAGLVAQIQGLPRAGGGGTDFNVAVTAMLNAITSSPIYDPANRQVMNLSTDGGGSFNTAAQHAALLAAGIDQLSAEAVGPGAAVNFLRNSVVFPTPGYIAPRSPVRTGS